MTDSQDAHVTIAMEDLGPEAMTAFVPAIADQFLAESVRSDRRNLEMSAEAFHAGDPVTQHLIEKDWLRLNGGDDHLVMFEVTDAGMARGAEVLAHAPD